MIIKPITLENGKKVYVATIVSEGHKYTAVSSSRSKSWTMAKMMVIERGCRI